MTIPIVAFFNNKGGVGKTSLVYHLAWMYADLGRRVLAADLDPQANLTAAFLDEDRLIALWSNDEPATRQTVFTAVQPLIRGTGDVYVPALIPIEGLESSSPPLPLFDHSEEAGLALLAGDLSLSRFEEELSEQWPKCLDGSERGFRVISSFWRILQQAGAKHRSELILMDLGPNLGAINRTALLAADFLAIPLSPDLFSLQGLSNLGPTIRDWRRGWKERLQKNPAADLPLPSGRMEPAGYIVLQPAVRLDRPVKAYERWAARIPDVYREDVLAVPTDADITLDRDPHCLALLKHYRSLMPLAQEARKPMFHLKAADGAIGAHFDAARKARQDFEDLARTLRGRIGLS